MHDITTTRIVQCFPCKKLLCAGLAIVADGEYFRCVKNRYDSVAEDEKIPLGLLNAYIMRYSKYFSKEDLVNALVYETVS